jgi:uncharacterized alpha-E superfamily protein
MMSRLAESRAQLRWLLGTDGAAPTVVDIARIDGRHLESILIDMASLVGLWNESVVRGPAWRFGEIGRRLERAFGVVDGVRGAFELHMVLPDQTAVEVPLTGRLPDDVDFQRQRLIEIVLASNESLVAYRRRHRSDVELSAALHLVVGDIHNPRAAAAAIRQVRHQADRLGWMKGLDVTSALLERLEVATFGSVEEIASTLTDVFAQCDLLARDVVGSYLAAPVDPRLMGRG